MAQHIKHEYIYQKKVFDQILKAGHDGPVDFKHFWHPAPYHQALVAIHSRANP
ncbi:hypothetical protein [Comamonas humi]